MAGFDYGGAIGAGLGALGSFGGGGGKPASLNPKLLESQLYYQNAAQNLLDPMEMQKKLARGRNISDAYTKGYGEGNVPAGQQAILNALRDPNSYRRIESFSDPRLGGNKLEKEKGTGFWSKFLKGMGIAGAGIATGLTGGAASPLLAAAIGAGGTAASMGSSALANRQSRKGINAERQMRNELLASIVSQYNRDPSASLIAALRGGSTSGARLKGYGEGNISPEEARYQAQLLDPSSYNLRQGGGGLEWLLPLLRHSPAYGGGTGGGVV